MKLSAGPTDLGNAMRSTPMTEKKRKLDFLIAVYNRPAYLHRLLKTGLALNVPGAYFVVMDDCSSQAESVPGLGDATVEAVCRSFNDPRVIYSRNPENMSVAKSLARYYRELCDADYTSLLNPKDEFIDGEPICDALAKLDADPALSFVVYPLRQGDLEVADKLLDFQYARMTGKEFIARHIEDANLQHCSGYAVMRVSNAVAAGIPNNLDLRSYGLEDASGIDHDMLFRMATLGDVDFTANPPIRRWIGDGYTQRFPLTFGYSQYQYARRLVLELGPGGWISRKSQRDYLSFRLMLVLWGAMAIRSGYTGVVEKDFSRLGNHLRSPLWLYTALECLRFRIWPSRRMISLYVTAFMPWLPESIRSRFRE
jgi:hypothetical protein